MKEKVAWALRMSRGPRNCRGYQDLEVLSVTIYATARVDELKIEEPAAEPEEVTA